MGELVWCKQLSDSKFHGLTIDIDENIYACGSFNSNLALVKFNLDGVLQKQHQWSPMNEGRAEGRNIAISQQGDLVISGLSESYIGTWIDHSSIVSSLAPVIKDTPSFWSEEIIVGKGNPGYSHSNPEGYIDSNEEGQKVLLMIIPADELDNL